MVSCIKPNRTFPNREIYIHSVTGRRSIFFLQKKTKFTPSEQVCLFTFIAHFLFIWPGKSIQTPNFAFDTSNTFNTLTLYYPQFCNTSKIDCRHFHFSSDLYICLSNYGPLATSLFYLWCGSLDWATEIFNARSLVFSWVFSTRFFYNWDNYSFWVKDWDFGTFLTGIFESNIQCAICLFR